jgi:hypothetical protein
MILKILAAALTGIGGHYLNRRWDKALFFCCLFVLNCITAYLVFSHLLISLPPENGNFEEQLRSYSILVKNLVLVGISLIWLVSLVTTLIDHKKHTTPNMVKWTPSAIASAVISSGLTMLIIYYVVSATLVPNTVWTDTTENTERDSSISYGPPGHNFYAGVYFGGVPRNLGKLPAPQAGNGVLRGQITYHGQPAAGITMHVVLNEKYKTADLVTDSDGIFTINLKPGKWRINSIQTWNWENRPDKGGFTMYYGGEAKLKGEKYSRFTNRIRDGYEVEVGRDPHAVQFKSTINDDIKLVWPDSKGNDQATIEDSITWERLPGAGRYYVEIDRVTQEGSSTIFSPITGKVVPGGDTALPLSSLKHHATANDKKEKYSVNVFAFAGDGTLIGEHTRNYDGGAFTLADGQILIEDAKDTTFGLSEIDNQDRFEKTLGEISANERREKAVAVLIEEDMLETAEKLLGRMDSEYSRGRKEVMAGYLLAVKGECTRAAAMFDRAADVDPDVCIADKYWAGCEH